MTIRELKTKLKKGHVQFFNDAQNIKTFSQLTDQYYNAFGYYYTFYNYSTKPFNLPVIKLSEYKKIDVNKVICDFFESKTSS